MSAEPRPQDAEYLNEVNAQLLCVQRSYRDRIILELPASLCQGLPDTYVLECHRLPFSPLIFREVCLRLAPLLTENNPQADFVPLLSKLDDATLEKLAEELQHAPEQDLPQALNLAVQEVRLHKLSPLDFDALHSLLLAAFVPFFSAYAKQQNHLELGNWQKGWCPICGQYPINGLNRSGDGRRVFGCWMCETQWSFARLTCPVCSSRRQEGQMVLTALGDLTRRIQVCEDCGHYLKITDCTQAEEDCDLQLENAATIYLDILAQRKGYRPASHPLALKQ